MEQQRNLLLIVFLCLLLFLFWSWGSDQRDAMRRAAQESAGGAASIYNISSDDTSGKTISLKSDALDLTLSLQGGDIVDAKLPLVKQELDKPDPFHLMMTNNSFVYQAQSGLAGKDGPDSRARPLYTTEQDAYVLEDGRNEVSAALHFEQDGVSYVKTYTLKRGSYAAEVNYQIDNQSGRDLNMSFYGQLKQTADDSFLRNQTSFAMVASAYRGTAYSTEESRYEKVALDDIAEGSEKINLTTKNGWVAMIQHYFVSAWIGDEKTTNVIYTNATRDGLTSIIGIRTESTVIPNGTKAGFTSKMWIGPKNQDQMGELAPNLDLTVDYGWLWFISIPLFKILAFVHSIIGNWGFSIIVLTLIVRSVMFPLTKAQYTSMAKMRLLAPKMQEIKERYGDDRQKMGQETMSLYKKEKVNPLGGCLPLLIQMPIFIALYWTLMESTELRQSSFILWITDLSVHDPFFVLPILYGISMFMLQKMSPTPITDPIQRKVFMAMPFVFTFMFCTFPAGLTLYWLVSNCFTIFQQTIIFRSLEKKGLSMRAPVSAKETASKEATAKEAAKK